MAGPSLHTFIRRLHYLGDRGEHRALSDAELLERFIARQDEAAFEVLVWRHGPMVWAACRGCLRREQDAEDAFQACFLSLAREARDIRRPAALAGWLQRVAFRIALRLKTRGQRLQAGPLNEEVESVPAKEVALEAFELRPVLDEEVQRLPEKYRTAFILCYLEGLTCAEAALRMGRSPGTVVTWLARARQRLRTRLTRRGIVAALVSGVVLDQAPAAPAVPARLIVTAVEAGVRLAAGQPLNGLASPSVCSLMQGATFPMLNLFSGRGAIVGLFVAVALAFVAGPVAMLACGTSEGSEPREQPVRPTRARKSELPENQPKQWLGYQSRETAAGPELAILYEDGRTEVVPCAADAVLLAYLGDETFGQMTVPMSVDLRDQNRFLLRFEDLPAGKIRKAELLLRLSEGLSMVPSRPFELGVHEVEEEWDEVAVTWNNQPRFARKPALTVVVNPQAHELHVDVTPLVQRQARAEGTGYGWLFKVARPLPDPESAGERRPEASRSPTQAPREPRWVGFTTRESNAGPELRVEWDDGSVATYPAGADAVLIAYLENNAYGSLETWLSIDLKDTNRILLRFDVPNHGKVRKAELILKAVPRSAGGQSIPLPKGPFKIGIHEVLERWEEPTVTWATQPASTRKPEKTFTVNPAGKEWRLDVTGLAQRAASGSGHGWLLRVVRDTAEREP